MYTFIIRARLSFPATLLNQISMWITIGRQGVKGTVYVWRSGSRPMATELCNEVDNFTK